MTQLDASIFVDLNGNVTQNARRFTGDIERFSSSGARRLQMMQRSAAALGRQIDRVGNRVAIGAVAMGYAFNRMFINTASQFEKIGIQLRQLEGSAEAGQKALDWVTEFAARTPLELQDVLQAFVRLRTFGINPMDGALQALVDQNAKMAGSSENLEGMIIAVGQAWTKQKLQGEEIMQLMERGVPVWDLLADATGRSVGELQKLSEAGRLGRKSIALLIEEIGKNSVGAADEFAKTYEGMISNLSDRWTQFQVHVMQAGAFDYIKGEVEGLLGAVNTMKEDGSLSDAAKEFSDNIVAGLQTAKEILVTAKEVGEGIGEVVMPIIKATNWIAEQGGGYANIGKVLAAVYVANKAIRFVGPLASLLSKGAMAGYGKIAGKGKKSDNPLINAASGMTPIPVFVVNDLPGFGRGAKGGRGGVPLPGGKKGVSKLGTFGMLKNQRLGNIAAMGGPAILRAAGLVGLAGAAGGLAGTGINKFFIEDNTELSDSIGRAVAFALAGWGNDEAIATLDREINNKIQIELTGDLAGNARVKRVEGGSQVDVNGAAMGGY